MNLIVRGMFFSSNLSRIFWTLLVRCHQDHPFNIADLRPMDDGMIFFFVKEKAAIDEKRIVKIKRKNIQHEN